METSSPVSALKVLTRRTAFLSIFAGILTALFSMTLKNEYRANATLLLAPLPFKSANDQQFPPVPEKANFLSVNLLMVQPLTVPDYKVLLESNEVVDAIRKRFVELRASQGESGEIALEDVRDAMAVRTRVQKQTAYDVVYQPVIDLEFVATDPKLAADLANVWAEQGILLATTIARKGEEGMLDFLQQQVAEKADEVDAVEAQLQKLTEKMVIENVEEQLKLLESQIASLQIELTKLTADIAHSEAELTELNKQLEEIPEMLTLRHALPDDAYWILQSQGKTPDSSKVFVREVVNEVYSETRRKKVEIESTLRGMIAEKAAREAGIMTLQSATSTLRRDMAANVRERDLAERQKKTLDDQYLQLASSSGAARVAVATRTPDLKMAAQAVPPNRKIGPMRSLLVACAMLLAACIAPVYFVVERAISYYSRMLEQGVDAQRDV